MKKIKTNIKNKALYTALAVIAVVIIMLVQRCNNPARMGAGDYGDADVILHMIDVGQGDAFLIDNGDKDILIDAGTEDSAASLIDYLDSVGCYDIEYAFFTHAHEDHIGGADDVLIHCDVKNVVISDYTSDSASYRNLTKAVNNRGCKLMRAFSGDVFNIGGVTVEVLSPGKGYKTDEINHTSLVMKVSYGKIDTMFTGDAEAVNESYMLRRYPDELDCEILKAGHHGSSTSSTEDFVAAVSPEAVLIPLGKDNQYGHPHREALAIFNSYCDEIRRTDKDGDVVIGMNEEKFWFIKP